MYLPPLALSAITTTSAAISKGPSTIVLTTSITDVPPSTGLEDRRDRVTIEDNKEFVRIVERLRGPRRL